MGELAPHETLQTKYVDPLGLGIGKVVGNRRPLGAVPHPGRQLWPTTRGVSAVKTSVLPCLG